MSAEPAPAPAADDPPARRRLPPLSLSLLSPLSPKLLLVGGAAIVLLAASGAGAAWLLAGPKPTAPAGQSAAHEVVDAAVRTAAPAAVQETPRAEAAASNPAQAAASGAQAADAPAAIAAAAGTTGAAGGATGRDGAADAAHAAAAEAMRPAGAAAATHAADAVRPADAAGATAAGIAAIAGLSGVAPVAAAPAGEAARSLPAAGVQAPAEDPLDRIRRRLGEVLGSRGRFDDAGAGELRLVTRGAELQPVATAPEPARRPPQRGARPAASPAAAAPAAGGDAPHWGYGQGAGGPSQWGRLHPDFAACASGLRQSPIDIRGGIALDLEAPQFDYRPGPFRVVDTGRTVQVEVAPGNALVLGGKRYALQQFHFHRPSEERIDGKRHDLGVHLVHQADDGALAVVAVLIGPGTPLPVLQSVWNHLPLEPGEPGMAGAALDPAELLPADRGYYTYTGSLTTPPCSEGVLWLVLRQPVGADARQLGIFARLYPMNARPVQALAGRLIKQSN